MAKRSSKPVGEQSPAKQLAGFIAKFDPAIQKLVRSARSALRKQFPTAIELVYDNYNALAIGFSSTEKASSALFSLAVYASGVNLYFIYGATLPDPNHILQGSGNQGRFVRLQSVAQLKTPEIQALMLAAAKRTKPPLPVSGRGYTLIKMVNPKQRPRRPILKVRLRRATG